VKCHSHYVISLWLWQRWHRNPQTIVMDFSNSLPFLIDIIWAANTHGILINTIAVKLPITLTITWTIVVVFSIEYILWHFLIILYINMTTAFGLSLLTFCRIFQTEDGINSTVLMYILDGWIAIQFIVVQSVKWSDIIYSFCSMTV